MRCPKCNHFDTRVIDSRSKESENRVRRRRECARCKWRFTTYESVFPRLPKEVIKRDERCEPFDREKLLRSMRLAWRNRSDNSEERLKQDSLTEQVLSRISLHPGNTIETEAIAQWVKDALRQHDPTACILYASVNEKVRSFAQWQELINRERNALPVAARKRQMNLLDNEELDFTLETAEEETP